MFSTVLAALDPTERAPRVLRAATEVAERFSAQLYVCRAIDIAQGFPPSASTAAHRDALPDYLMAQALHELAALCAGNPLALAHPAIVKAGPTTRVILEAAGECGADLLVVGRHGIHGLDHLLGTTTRSVAERASCHVLVVHRD